MTVSWRRHPVPLSRWPAAGCCCPSCSPRTEWEPRQGLATGSWHSPAALCHLSWGLFLPDAEPGVHVVSSPPVHSGCNEKVTGWGLWLDGYLTVVRVTLLRAWLHQYWFVPVILSVVVPYQVISANYHPVLEVPRGEHDLIVISLVPLQRPGLREVWWVSVRFLSATNT